MVNLLSRGARPDPFSGLDAQAWGALLSRVWRCVAFRQDAARATFQAHVETLAGELDELESAPSLVSASSLIEAIDQMRREGMQDARPVAGSAGLNDLDGLDAPGATGAGSLLCYFPGRSLSTGEAEVASRGYFDALDRPPLWSWVAVVGRRSGGTAQDFEVGVLAWVAPEDAAAAHAGCQASAAPSVMPVETASEAIAAQWRSAGGRGIVGSFEGA